MKQGLMWYKIDAVESKGERERESSKCMNIVRMRIVDLILEWGFVLVYRKYMHSNSDLLISRWDRDLG